MCSPLYGPCEEGAGPCIQRIVHSSRVVAVYVNNDHVVTVTAGLGLLCTSCLIRLSNLLDPSQSTHLYQMGLYLYSLIKKYIKVASTVIYPWWCGVTASHWHSNHPNAYDSMSGILNQGQYLRFHLLVMRMNRVQTLKPISGRWNMTLQQFETIHQMWW